MGAVQEPKRLFHDGGAGEGVWGCMVSKGRHWGLYKNQKVLCYVREGLGSLCGAKCYVREGIGDCAGTKGVGMSYEGRAGEYVWGCMQS